MIQVGSQLYPTQGASSLNAEAIVADKVAPESIVLKMNASSRLYALIFL